MLNRLKDILSGYPDEYDPTNDLDPTPYKVVKDGELVVTDPDGDDRAVAKP